jgi:hypothetical protein
MPIKPIPLAAYCPEFIPPVTGVNGLLAPVANSYDTSGNFSGRPRIGSASKKRRIGEMDDMFDLSQRYPPLTLPGRPELDLKEIKTLMVTAAAAGDEVRPLLEAEDVDPKIKAFGSLSLALLQVISAIVENGLVPLAGNSGRTGSGTTNGSGSGPNGRNSAPAPPPKTPAPGRKELRDALEKADTESILFDADLGKYPSGNRAGLANNFSEGLRKLAIAKATETASDPGEAVRAMNDALGCVNDMDFIGIRSEPIRIREHGNQPVKDCHTMPVKLRFEDKSSRLHFERTIKGVCGLRAAMSLPKPIREEQAVLGKALRDRYPGFIVTVRPDPETLHWTAFRKINGEGKWTQCPETVPIPNGILLPGYNIRKEIPLPPLAVAVTATSSDSSENSVEMENADKSEAQSNSHSSTQS